MNPVILTEDTLAEQPALEWFRELGYEVTFGLNISPGGLRPKRESFSDVVRKRRLRSAFEKLNPHLPQKAIEDALHQLLSLDSPDMFVNNPKFHLMAVNGVKVGNRVVTVGLVNHSLVHPREVPAEVITDRAASVILVHNHPSGTLSANPLPHILSTSSLSASIT